MTCRITMFPAPWSTSFVSGTAEPVRDPSRRPPRLTAVALAALVFMLRPGGLPRHLRIAQRRARCAGEAEPEPHDRLNPPEPAAPRPWHHRPGPGGSRSPGPTPGQNGKACVRTQQRMVRGLITTDDSHLGPSNDRAGGGSSLPLHLRQKGLHIPR